MQTQPFKRAHDILNLMNAILSSNEPQSIKNLLLGNLPAYVSRGHGRGIRTKQPKINTATNWKQKLNGQTCGKRECARRVRQMQGA